MIVIVDSGGANLVSLLSAFTRLGAKAKVSASIEDINRASHVILPGVGCAKNIMKRLNDLRLVDAIKSLTTPVLGICVGMQILFDYCEEGETSCLGIMPGEIKKLPQSLILPHMGWNSLRCQKSLLFENVPDSSYVYYVHSYAAALGPYTIAQTDYGQPFSAAVSHRNFLGLQFHPERSGEIGSKLLKNFLEHYS